MTPPESLLSKLIAARPLAGAEAIEPPESIARYLGHSWREAGVTAHGAAAAQAEFAVGLLRLAAPADLLRGAARGMLDEAALSAACLGLAGRYGAAQVRLSPIPRRDSAPEVDRNELVLSTLRRGCVAAAVEASCAREALEHCQDAAVREVLLQMEHGRARTAQLSWRFMGWALRETGRELADQVRVAVLTTLGAQASVPQLSVRDRQLLRHGVLGAAQRLAIEQRVLRDVVLPCMENTLARAVRGGRAA
jgi:hypothetical protein